MRTIVQSAICFILFSMCVMAQNKAKSLACNVKIDELQSIRGVKLNMALEEVKKQYPKVEFTFGIGFLIANEITNNEYRKDVYSMMLIIRDDKLSQFGFTYEPSIRWNSLREFAEKISSSFNLPNKFSNYKKETGTTVFSQIKSNIESATMKCNGFEIEINFESIISSNRTGTYPSITISKTKEQTEKEEKPKKEAFKP